ncbi:hypothetical protein DFH08DRAFT_784035 [Mycena albidolilacea]|uniref:Uncharacterized protein n=1 Tax=Mycena albidolilacea TaxID=1033008 RepID=A0AAD6ZT86_9AGAR|nr:hypothetical protein DFH08DRAFT_784035 [Mycena albidolilacea]
MADSLPPAEIQRQIQVSAYVFSGATAVLFWDILNNLGSDYSILFEQKFQWSVLVYLGCRVGSAIYALGFTIFVTTPLRDCLAVHTAFNIFYSIGVSATALLFFLRLRAIWGGDRLITILFGFLWLAVLGSSTTVPISGTARSVGNPPECLIGHPKSYAGSPGIIITVHDTLVYFAISYRLVSNFSHLDGQQTRRVQLKALFSGSNLPAFSKSLFTDGQVYYMITVIVNIVTTVMIYVPGISAVYHSILVVPNVLLTSIMACRVYRNTRLIVHRSPELSIPTLNDRNLNIPLSVGHFSPGSGMTGSLGRSEGDLANPEFASSKRGASKSIPSFQTETAVP